MNNQAKNHDIKKVAARETLKHRIAGVSLVAYGLALLVLVLLENNNLIDQILFAQLRLFSMIFVVVAGIALSSSIVTKLLIKSSRDEYEHLLSVGSKAKAFIFLNYTVFFIALILPGTGLIAMALILISLGISWLIATKDGGHIAY